MKLILPPPPPPDPEKDPCVEIGKESWISAVGMGLVYIGIVAIVILICAH